MWQFKWLYLLYMKRILLIAAALLALTLGADARNYGFKSAEQLASMISASGHEILGTDSFYGYDRVSFDFEGHKAWVVLPKKGTAREGRPWTWTMQWAEAFVPRTNVPQMLADGYHHVTIDTFDHRMDEEGLRISADFQKFLVGTLGFAPKANLIGMSWGGFFSVRYASRYPDSVRKIYLDAPLLNFDGFNPESIGPWKDREPAEGWSSCAEMPVNMAGKIASAGIPVLIVYGGQDQTVPPGLNSAIFIERLRNAGASVKDIFRGGYGHHPHGIELDDLTIKEFFDR